MALGEVCRKAGISPAVVPRFSFRALNVIKVLDRVCGGMGYLASIRVD